MSSKDAWDWFAISFTLIGVPVSIVGLGLAFHEARKSGKIASAAKSAVERTERHLAGNHLMGFTPRLTTLEDDLLKVCTSNNRNKTVDIVIRWREITNELLGLFDERDDIPKDLRTSFLRLAGEISQAIIEIPENRETMLVQTKTLRAAIVEATGSLSRFISRLKYSASEDGKTNVRTK